MAGIQTLADIKALEETAVDDLGLANSTYETLQATAQRRPLKPAFHFLMDGLNYTKPVTFTYRELLGKINQAANMFHDLGVGKEDVIAVILPNAPEMVFTIFGGEAAGIICLINPLLEPEVMADIMQAANAKVLVTLAPLPKVDIWQKVSSIIDDVPTLRVVLQVDLSNYLSGIKRFGAKLLAKRIKGSPVHLPVYDFNVAMKRYPTVELLSNRRFHPEDVASYLHTGGTTGIPKLAQRTHRNEVFDAWSALQALNGGPEENAKHVMFGGLPLFHNNGMTVTAFIPFMMGGTLVLGSPSGYRGEGIIPNFWKIVEHYKVSLFSGVPTVYSALLNVPMEGADVSSLKFAICGAAPMPVELFRQFEERTGLRILEGYGLTEGTSVCTVNPAAGERRVGSIGYRLPHQQIKVVILDGNGDYLRDARPDEIGVLIIRGPNVFKGYTEPKHNEKVWLDTGDGHGAWLNTGDMGRQDPEGYFWLTGRKKELIIRGGHNIDPKAIEEPLHEHPAVALAAAIGRPDARVGELPMVYVQLKPETQATEDELMTFAKEHIGERAAIPKQVKIVDALPVTAVGKIHKLPLVWREIEDVFAHELSQIEPVAAFEIEAYSHKTKGTVVNIHITPKPSASQEEVTEAVRHVLGNYTITYELIFK